MFNLLCCAIAIGLLVIYLQWLNKCNQTVWRHIGKFPGPFAWPLLGNILQIGFKPEDYFKTLSVWSKAYYYKTIRLYVGSQPYLFLFDREEIEQVLSSNTLTFKYDIYNLTYDWLGQGLLNSNGKYWLSHRKMITPSFHFRILKDFLRTMNETTDRFILFLESFSEKLEMFDFQEYVWRCTMDVICETAMGTQLHTIEGEKSPIIDATENMCYIVQERAFSYFKRFDIIFRLSPLHSQMSKSLQILKSEFATIIEERRKILPQLENFAEDDDDLVNRPRMAFLDNLLTAKVDGKPLTFQEIFEEVSTFMFEGHDTTASAITFTMYCLSRYSEIQQKAYDEQYVLYGNDRKRQPTYQELQDMKYLELVIKESLRLFPSVPYIFRTLKDSATIAGKHIPKNTTLAIPIFGIGRSERNYPQPFVFMPERFDPDKRDNLNPFDFVPFSAGPRNCIGQKFAMMEIKVTISKIVRHFHILPPVDGLPSRINDLGDPKIKLTNPYDPILYMPITLKSMNGVYLRLKKRDL